MVGGWGDGVVGGWGDGVVGWASNLPVHSGGLIEDVVLEVQQPLRHPTNRPTGIGTGVKEDWDAIELGGLECCMKRCESFKTDTTDEMNHVSTRWGEGGTRVLPVPFPI